MKYWNEIKEMFSPFFEYWMDEDDKDELIKEILKTIGTTPEKLANDIEIGIKNGYSLKTQIKLIKQISNYHK